MNTKRTQLHTTTYPKLHRGEVPLGRFLYEESAVGRVKKFNMILKNLKIFFFNFNCVLN